MTVIHEFLRRFISLASLVTVKTDRVYAARLQDIDERRSNWLGRLTVSNSWLMVEEKKNPWEVQ